MEYQETPGENPFKKGKQHEQEVNITYRRRSISSYSNRMFRQRNKQYGRHICKRSFIGRSISFRYRGAQRHTVNERFNIYGKGYQGCKRRFHG